MVTGAAPVDGEHTAAGGSVRTPVQITSWPGKPTSGRSVYRSRHSLQSSVWWWQCDLHDDDPVPDDQWGGSPTWRGAMDGALAHAVVCPFVSASSVR